MIPLQRTWQQTGIGLPEPVGLQNKTTPTQNVGLPLEKVDEPNDHIPLRQLCREERAAVNMSTQNESIEVKEFIMAFLCTISL